MLPGRGWGNISPGNEFQDHHRRWGVENGGARRRSVSPSGPEKLWALLSWQLRGWPKVKESSTPFPADPYDLLAHTSSLVFYSQRSQNGHPHGFSKRKCYIKNDNNQIFRITWLNSRSERSVPCSHWGIIHQSWGGVPYRHVSTGPLLLIALCLGWLLRAFWL